MESEQPMKPHMCVEHQVQCKHIKSAHQSKFGLNNRNFHKDFTETVVTASLVVVSRNCRQGGEQYSHESKTSTEQNVITKITMHPKKA